MKELQETWIWFLCREDPLEEEMATHFTILAWRIPWTEEPDRLQSTGSQRVGHDWATRHASVQFSRSVVSDSLLPHELYPCQAPLSITNSHSLLKLMSIESVVLFNHLILCLPLLLTFNLSQHKGKGLFQWVSSSYQVAKVLQFQL